VALRGGSVTGREESMRSDAWFFLQKRMKRRENEGTIRITKIRGS
jgi:hypothetical protein